MFLETSEKYFKRKYGNDGTGKSTLVKDVGPLTVGKSKNLPAEGKFLTWFSVQYCIKFDVFRSTYIWTYCMFTYKYVHDVCHVPKFERFKCSELKIKLSSQVDAIMNELLGDFFVFFLASHGVGAHFCTKN